MSPACIRMDASRVARSVRGARSIITFDLRFSMAKDYISLLSSKCMCVGARRAA